MCLFVSNAMSEKQPTHTGDRFLNCNKKIKRKQKCQTINILVFNKITYDYDKTLHTY